MVSEQYYEYEKVPEQVDNQGNSLSDVYPYGIKVRSTKGIKRLWHLDRQILSKVGENNPYYGVVAFALADFHQTYQYGTQAEWETFFEYVTNLANDITDVISNYNQYKYGVGESGYTSNGQSSKYKISTYKEMNIRPRQKRVTSYTYSDARPDVYRTTVQEFNYDDYNQLVSQQTTDAKGISTSAQYYYPYHPDINATTLLDQYRIAAPLRTETYRDGELQSTAVVNFTTDTNGYYLPAYLAAAKAGAPLQETTLYHRYDDRGNPIEVSQGKGPHTVYIWGYQQSYPIAKIGNSSYAQVAPYISELQDLSDADIDRTQDSSGTEGALRTALDELRTQLPNAIVTSYTYDPLIGVTSTTDPRGYTLSLIHI